MVPEYSKAAAGLAPLVPLYAVDCDAAPNKPLCAEQGVQGFPTVKLFRRGAKLPALTYESGERTSKAFFGWAARNVPNLVAAHKRADDVEAWVDKVRARLPLVSGTPFCNIRPWQHAKKPRALLLNKDKKTPLLWQVLSNQHRALEFAALPDTHGKAADAMGFPTSGDKVSSKVLVYPKDGARPVLYEGAYSLSLSPFSLRFRLPNVPLRLWRSCHA
jgi:protein disulfide-isomerase A6